MRIQCRWASGDANMVLLGAASAMCSTITWQFRGDINAYARFSVKWHLITCHMAFFSCVCADCDVYFRLPMKLVDWGTPLPTAIGMG